MDVSPSQTTEPRLRRVLPWFATGWCAILVLITVGHYLPTPLPFVCRIAMPAVYLFWAAWTVPPLLQDVSRRPWPGVIKIVTVLAVAGIYVTTATLVALVMAAEYQALYAREESKRMGTNAPFKLYVRELGSQERY